MPTVTALHGRDNGRVAVELDGRPWRVLSVEAAARCELGVGSELDRPRLRALARALRRERALAAATRALRHRDVTAAGLSARLERVGVAPADRRAALAVLSGAGFVDDERFAAARAQALVRRGQGDEAIRWDLVRQGVDAELAERVVRELEPESRRASRLAAERGPGAATARLLARRGFGAEAIESALAALPGAEA